MPAPAPLTPFAPPPAPNRPGGDRLLRWSAWWRTLGLARRWLPLGGVGIYLVVLGLTGRFRVDHAELAAAVLGLAYGGPQVDWLFQLLLPMALMGVAYDGQALLRPFFGHQAIHVTEPAAFDRRFFGIRGLETILTPSEWWQGHTRPVLDLICSFTYLSFVPEFLAVAIWFAWRSRRQGSLAERRTFTEMRLLTWCFLALGIMGIVTYFLYPAAPPWYLAKYGPGPAILTAAPSAGGAARVDAMLGIKLFASFYGRNPNAFGAIPSLHVAIPFLAFCFACRIGRWRIGTGLFAATMAFSAIYLNHHYVLDILWGWAYVGLLVAVIGFFPRRPEATA